MIVGHHVSPCSAKRAVQGGDSGVGTFIPHRWQKKCTGGATAKEPALDLDSGFWRQIRHQSGSRHRPIYSLQSRFFCSARGINSATSEFSGTKRLTWRTGRGRRGHLLRGRGPRHRARSPASPRASGPGGRWEISARAGAGGSGRRPPFMRWLLEPAALGQANQAPGPKVASARRWRCSCRSRWPGRRPCGRRAPRAGRSP